MLRSPKPFFVIKSSSLFGLPMVISSVHQVSLVNQMDKKVLNVVYVYATYNNKNYDYKEIYHNTKYKK